MRITHDIKRNMRGAILLTVYQRRSRQEKRHDLKSLVSVLNNLDFIVGTDVVCELVQDLCIAGYLTCVQGIDPKTSDTTIEKVTLTPEGRNIVEQIKTDPAIDV